METETMSIYTLPGKKIRLVRWAGYDGEIEMAKEVLEMGRVYTVKRTDVGQSHTSVYIEEVPTWKETGREYGINSVMFENVDPQTEDDDKLHYQWAFYNR